MSYSNQKHYLSNGLTTLSFFCAVILAINIFAGCGENSNTVIPSALNAITETVIPSEDRELVVDSDDSYYVTLEKKLNDELDVNRAPDKCAAQGLTKIVLNCTTDEIQTCSTYDLSKVIVNAYFSDKTAEVITPTWSIYSGGGTLDGTIYTATNKPAIIVFKALYTENGISKLALFRLTVTGLISISLNKTTDEIMLPATYDLSNELIIIAKLSNGTTKTIVKGDSSLLLSLASGAGTLADDVYTPSAKIETAVFNASYSEAGITKTAQFKLKVTGLSSLILSKTTDEVNSCETYDLASKIVVSNKLSNGSINDITSSQNLTWTLSSGAGILANKIYTAPAKAETAVFTASYTEADITKTAQFRLKVTGLSSVVLDKTTDEIMLPATYDLASEIHATAKFSDGESKSVDLIWSLSYGSGVLSGSIYAPAPKPETAVFIGSYTENGITKTAQFRLKVIGLSSLTLSKTTDEVVSCAAYDLSQIVVSDKLSNGTINNITNSTTWKLISGFGTLSDKTYTAPARAETAVFTANYTEAGITKTTQFRLKIIALASISLSKTTDEAQILTQYDLASNIAVTAKLSNGQAKPVSGNDPNLKWTLSYGSGVLSGTLYTPSEKIETAILTATYTENGVAQSAQLRLKSTATLRGKIELIGLTLNKTTDSVAVGQTYDLSKLIIIAKFADKTTMEVSLSWIITSGGGTLVGNIFTAPANVGTVRFMGSFVANDGSVKSVYLILTVYNAIDYRTVIFNSSGGSLALSNGLTLIIPQGAITDSAEVTFELIKHEKFNTPNDIVFNIKSSAKINKSYVVAPSPYDNIGADCILAEKIDLNSSSRQIIPAWISATSENNILVPASKNLSLYEPIQQIHKTQLLLFTGVIGATIYNNSFYYAKFVPYYKVQNDSVDFELPYYIQPNKGCAFASLLITLKTYRKVLDTWAANSSMIGNNIYRLAYFLKKPISDGMQLADGPYGLPDFGIMKDMINSCTVSGNTTLETFKASCPTEFANFVLDSIINKKTPLMFEYKSSDNDQKHMVVILGYSLPHEDKNYDRLKFIVHDPAVCAYHEISYNYIWQKVWVQIASDDLFGDILSQTWFAGTGGSLNAILINPNKPIPTLPNSYKVDKKAVVLQSIHMSDGEISFAKAGEQEPNYVVFNHLSKTGYSFTKQQNDIIPDFDEINLKKILICNTDKDMLNLENIDANKPKVRISIYNKLGYENDENNEKSLIYEDDKDVNSLVKANNGIPGYYFQLNGYKIPWSKFKGNEPNIQTDTPKFKRLIAAGDDNDTEFTIIIAIVDQNNPTIRPDGLLDSFTIKFKYTPPKELIINSAPKHDFIGNNIQYASKYGDVDVTPSTVWKVTNPDSNVITDGQGVFVGGLLKTTGEITAITEYNILASYTDPNSHVTSTQEVKLKLLPGIIPNKKTFVSNVAQSFQLALATEIMDDRTTCIAWSGDSINSSGVYSFVAHENRKDQITARLVKGTMLQTGETLETDLYAHATMQVYNMYLEPQTKMIDINEKCPFDLKWDAGPNNMVYFTNQAEWSCSNGTIEITNNRAVYTPSKPGVDIITAKIAEGTFIRENSNDVISGNDVEFTAEVTVVEIKVLEQTPLVSRIEPVDAAGSPMSNYRIEKEFSVSVDGATVPIELPYVDSNKGTIQLIGTTDGNVLPVIHTFKYTPTPPMTATPYYFNSDDTLHVNIKSSAFEQPSASAEIVVYKPLQKTIATFYPSGRKFQTCQYMCYTDIGAVYLHGTADTWFDNPTSSYQQGGMVDRGQVIGVYRHYLEDGKLQDWYNFTSFTNASLTSYEYTYSYGTPITRTYFYTLTRQSIYEGWNSTYTGTYTSSGWVPPAHTLPPTQ